MSQATDLNENFRINNNELLELIGAGDPNSDFRQDDPYAIPDSDLLWQIAKHGELVDTPNGPRIILK